MSPQHARSGARRWSLAPLLAAPLALVVNCNCSDDEPAASDTPDPAVASAEPAPPERTELKTVDEKTAGNISGVVSATGTVPEPALIVMLGEAFCIQTHKDTGGGYLDNRILVQGGKLQNAFVWVKSGLEDYKFEKPTAPAALAQVDCLYTPRIIGIQLGQKVEVTNADPVLHNIHTKPERNRPTNLGQPANGPTMELRFRKEEVMVRVACDVHAWMSAWIGIVDHPYFAVTAEDGSYRLDGLPPGDYTLGVWHEQLGEKELTVQLEASGDVTAGEVVYQL